MKFFIPGLLFGAYLLLFLFKRVPLGHDGFQYLGMQYYFFNEAATYGLTPLWIPWIGQGVPANWWYEIQGAPLQNILLWLAPFFPEGSSFFPPISCQLFF